MRKLSVAAWAAVCQSAGFVLRWGVFYIVLGMTGNLDLAWQCAQLAEFGLIAARTLDALWPSKGKNEIESQAPSQRLQLASDLGLQFVILVGCAWSLE